MANGIDNLIPNSARSPEEVRENGRKGGIASGIARRRKKDLREACIAILNTDITTKAGEKMTGSEAMVAKLFQQAINGNIKAFEVLRDTAGQKPVEKLVVSEVDQSVIDEVENMVTGATDADVDNINDVTDDASPYARDDDDAHSFPNPAPVAGIVASDSKPTKQTKKRTTKKKTPTETNNSPFFDSDGDDS